MGIAHLDEAPVRDVDLGHLRARWSMVGVAAGCVSVGVRRIELPIGGWSTPAHEHGREEEIFYVLSGRGLSWQAGNVSEIGAGDCVVYLPGAGAHTLHALEPLAVLAFGERHEDESVGFPRLGMSYVGNRMVESVPGSIGGAPTQFVRESELGPPPLPDTSDPRPPTIVNLDDVEAVTVERPRVARTRRNLGRAAGSIATGLQHVVVMPDKESAPPHCHSLEEEIFVILDGDGVVVLGEVQTEVRPGHVISRPAGTSVAQGEVQTEVRPGHVISRPAGTGVAHGEVQTEVRPGHVISRPAGTGVAHVFRAGAGGLTYLAYGLRNPADVCYYPRSGKLAFRGVGVIARVERLDYWDGED